MITCSGSFLVVILGYRTLEYSRGFHVPAVPSMPPQALLDLIACEARREDARKKDKFDRITDLLMRHYRARASGFTTEDKLLRPLFLPLPLSLPEWEALPLPRGLGPDPKPEPLPDLDPEPLDFHIFLCAIDTYSQ
ncbi:hypothetical protein M9H77_11440 [Catharanthus roseus]|uniref:Uncharacterized protein n=1 Tax=Catharanthus roseus TaxID=4058 RepID=A0ACC0BEL9_CATRO|nr:hypothetical protein M9H77_11440 [Catharanthus roseus]